MANLVVAIPHVLGEEEALSRLQVRQHEVKSAYQQYLTNLEETWEGNSLRYRFSTFGINVRGTITVEPAQVVIRTELPMMAMMFKGAIEKQIREELGKVLAAPAAASELPGSQV